MEFKQLKCLIPRPDGQPCGHYFCDMDAVSSTTLRFTCRQKHAKGHGYKVKRMVDGVEVESTVNRIEFSQNNGVVSFRELPPDEKKSYATDNGVRFPAVEEEVAV